MFNKILSKFKNNEDAKKLSVNFIFLFFLNFSNFIFPLLTFPYLINKLGIKKSIKEYGVDEKYFLDTLDQMVEQAFNDQCTGANPRYPLMSEIKEMYLKAYYGK